MERSHATSDEDETSVLARRVEEIERLLEEIETGAVTAASGIGFGKRIGEGTNIAVERLSAVSMHDSLRTELKTVRRAQEKLERGTATACDVCGKPIGAERLEALPWAVQCVDCAL